MHAHTSARTAGASKSQALGQVCLRHTRVATRGQPLLSRSPGGPALRMPRAAAAASPGASPTGAPAAAPATAPPAAATGAPPPPPELPTFEHLILPPLPSNAAPADTDCLLAIAPGAFIPPSGFQALVEAAQAAAPHMRLWGGVIKIDAMQLGTLYGGPAAFASDANFRATAKAMTDADVYGKLLRQMLAQAEAKGFAPRKEGSGRLANVVILCQSAGGIAYPAISARAAAATILLGSTLNVEDYAAGHEVLSVEAWPRPVMMLCGELDGQMRWPWIAPYIAEGAALTSKLGSRIVAAEKPVIVVPGVNHGNTSNGIANVPRGDITAAVDDYATCMKRLGGHVADFMTSLLAPTTEAQAQAEESLLKAVAASAQLVAPYCAALGLGDVAAPFAAADAVSPPLEAPLGPVRGDGLLAGAPRTVGRSDSSAVHPGVVAAAEAHAVDLQRRVLADLPAADLSRLTIVATAHTDVETLLYNQPVMVPLGNGRWLLRVHVKLHFRALDGERPHLCPQAPEYWVKLKCAAFVAAMLGLPNPANYATPPPAELNQLALQRALAAAPAHVVERYTQHGRQLEFGDDVDAMAGGPVSPETFVRESRIKYRYPPAPAPPPAPAAPSGAPPGFPPPPPPPAPGPVRASSPYVLQQPAADVASKPLQATRFMGPYYAKVLSVAQAMEWVQLDSLRAIAAPW